MKAPVEFRPERLHRPDWYAERGGAWRLRASRCSGCGSLIFPVAQVCPRCWPPPVLEEAAVPETGRLLSWTTAEIAPAAFRPPYAFGYADLAPTVRLFGQIERASEDPPLVPDMEVRLVLGVVRHDEEDRPVWAYKFTPAARRGP